MRFGKIKMEYITIDISKCAKCWKCENVCTQQVFAIAKFLGMKYSISTAKLNSEACTGCMKCVRACPKGVFTKTEESGIKAVI